MKPLLAALLVCTAAAHAGPGDRTADTIFVNGRIVTLDAKSSLRKAMAVKDGRIVALSDAAGAPDLQGWEGRSTRIVDLKGRTVVPGLIDSHIHAIRAALSFSTEVNWIGAKSLDEALGRLRAAAAGARPGDWLIVAGGWTPEQFREKRRPTQAELAAAAPDHPVYVQLFYSWAILTPKGLAALGLAEDKDVPAGGKLERDAAGKLTGGVTGSPGTIIALFAKLPKPTPEQQVEGTKKFFAELNRLGLTGVIDPGGFGMYPSAYQALFKVWREGGLTLRVAYSYFAQDRGKELDDFKAMTQLMPMGLGDDWLRFNGIGENVFWGAYNVDAPDDAARERLVEILRWAAQNRMSVNMHWNNDRSVGVLLDAFERVDRETPIAPLRWAIAHLNDASSASLERMKALGVAWAMQDAMYYEGEQHLKEKGEAAVRRMPPLATAKKIGVRIGAGTDAHRVASYNPWAALQWMQDGRTVGGAALRDASETPSREDALRMSTQGSAWLAHAERERGSLEVGKLADFAVLSKDYLSVPVAEIGAIESVMTVVGGRI
ncbi:MAG TPA: amidohydrolase, partial [Burkholderiales bacterium]